MYQGCIPKKKKNRRPIDEIAPTMKLLQRNKIKNNNLNAELTEMGVFSTVAGNQLPNQLQKSTTGSLPPAVSLAITPTFSPWAHTSDDSYIYQLSLVLATASVSYG